MKGKRLALLLSLIMVMSTVPVSVAAETSQAGGSDGGVHITVTTPPALDPEPPITTTPSGLVTFTYPNFDTRTVNFNATTNFRVHAQLTRAAAESDFKLLRFEWLRNGHVWRGSGGSGYEKRGDIINPGFANLGLQLQGGLSHQQRGGEWSLRVTLIGADGKVISVDETHVITVTILGSPAPARTPSPGTGGGNQRPGGGRRPVNVVINQNRSTTIVNINVTVNTVINQAIRSGKQPRVVINLNQRQTGIFISNNNVRRLIQHRGSIVIVHQTVNVTINYTQMLNWNLESNVEINVNIRDITNENDLDNKFRRMRRKPKGFRTPSEMRRIFLKPVREVTITVTTNIVIEQRIEHTLSVNIRNLGLTAEQLTSLRGLFFYLENPDDPYSIVYKIVNGYVDEYGYFHILVTGDGWFTLILDEDADDEDDDDQGEDNQDENGVATTSPAAVQPAPAPQQTIRLSLGQTIVVQNGIVRQSDTVPFVDPITGDTMLPLRLVAESLGVTVNWVAETRTAVLIQQETTVSVTIDYTVPGVRGTPRIVNGRTFVTDHFIETVLNASVTVDVTTQEVYVRR